MDKKEKTLWIRTDIEGNTDKIFRVFTKLSELSPLNRCQTQDLVVENNRRTET